jgi:hypothetical protein
MKHEYGAKWSFESIKLEIIEVKKTKTFECQNQACLLNKKCKCNNDVVIKGKAPCFGKDKIQPKRKEYNPKSTRVLFLKEG